VNDPSLGQQAVVAEVRRRLEGSRRDDLSERRDRLTGKLAALDRRAAALLDAYGRSKGRLPWSTFEAQLTRFKEERAGADRQTERWEASGRAGTTGSGTKSPSTRGDNTRSAPLTCISSPTSQRFRVVWASGEDAAD